jgi:cbb3-type cytochrome oxidase subunit 1
MDNWALKFVRWGMGLTILGLITGYVPLGHYLMMGAIPSCPAAPIHGHTTLLSFVGMTMFGLAYRALPAWMRDSEPPLGLVRLHFWLAVVAIIGVCFNGTVGYEVLGILIQPGFYYLGSQGEDVRNLWFAIDGVFLTAYAIGCMVFLYIVMTRTAYTSVTSTSEAGRAQANQALHPTAAGAMLGGRG